MEELIPRQDLTDPVSTDRLTVSYGSVEAVSDVTLQVARGQIAGLVGRNGAGKSTLIRTFAGLLKPQSGCCRILGRSPRHHPKFVKTAAGYLLDSLALFAYLDAEETLRFTAEFYGLASEVVDSRVGDLLNFFDLEDQRGKLVEQFSVGMRKRLAIATALIHNPQILILDEPFESLDPLVVRRIKALLLEYVRSGGTVLLSSHLVDVVQEICDSFFILDEGKIVAAGPVQETVAAFKVVAGRGVLEDLYADAVPDRPRSGLAWLGSARTS